MIIQDKRSWGCYCWCPIITLTHECQNQCSAGTAVRSEVWFHTKAFWILLPHICCLNLAQNQFLSLWSLPTGKDSCSPLPVILIWAAKPHSPRLCVWGLISAPCSVPLTLPDVPIQTSLPFLAQDAFLHTTTSLLPSSALPCPASRCPSSRLPSFW